MIRLIYLMIQKWSRTSLGSAAASQVRKGKSMTTPNRPDQQPTFPRLADGGGQRPQPPRPEDDLPPGVCRLGDLIDLILARAVARHAKRKAS